MSVSEGYTASNGMTTGGSLMTVEKDFAKNGCDLIQALSSNFPGETEENYNTRRIDSDSTELKLKTSQSQVHRIKLHAAESFLRS